MIRYLLFICLATGSLLATPAIRAQSITGRVTDIESGEPLPGASVFVAATQIGTATGDDGRFSLDIPRPGTYRIVVSFVGFRSESRSVNLANEPVHIDVAMTPIEVEVSGITITAKAQASDILSTPQAVSVLEGRDLRDQRGVALFDALEKTPGVRTLSTGASIAKPMIRGLTSQRVLIIQNGLRQEGQQWGDEHGPELDSFDVDRIEVVKGPASLLYGSDALGGVIHVSGEDLFSHTRPLDGALTVQAMSNPELGGTNLQLGGSSGAIFYDGSATWKRAGSYETPRGIVPNTGLEETNGSIRVGSRFRRASLVAEYRRFDSKLAFFEPDEQIVGGRGGFQIDLPFQKVEHDKIRAKADVRFSQSRLEAVAGWQQNRRKEFEEEEEHEGISAEEENGPALFLRLSTLTTDVRFHHRPVGRLFGTVGVSGFYQKNETLAEESLIPGADVWNGAVYVFEELMLRRLTINGGLRYDARSLDVVENPELDIEAQSRTYDAFSGALGLAWQPVSSVSLALNAGRAWRAPALIELFGNGVHEGTVRFERGDPTLVPEQSLSVDGTVRWLHPHIHVEATGFVNRISDYIFLQRTSEIDPESGFVVYQYRRAGARILGGEMQVDIHPHPLEWLHFHVSGDIAFSENLGTGDPLPLSPPARLRLESALTAQELGPMEQVRFRFGPTLVAKQDRVAPLEIPTDGYSLWNASFSARVPAGAVVIEPLIAIDNLFDKAYVNHLSRFRPFGILERGRSVRLQVVATF